MTDSFAKPALTIDQQIAHLRRKGMAVEDEAQARYWLTHVSYYRLSAYWLYCEHPKGQSAHALAAAPASIPSPRYTILTECCVD